MNEELKILKKIFELQSEILNNQVKIGNLISQLNLFTSDDIPNESVSAKACRRCLISIAGRDADYQSRIDKNLCIYCAKDFSYSDNAIEGIEKDRKWTRIRCTKCTIVITGEYKDQQCPSHKAHCNNCCRFIKEKLKGGDNK